MSAGHAVGTSLEILSHTFILIDYQLPTLLLYTDVMCVRRPKFLFSFMFRSHCTDFDSECFWSISNYLLSRYLVCGSGTK